MKSKNISILAVYERYFLKHFVGCPNTGKQPKQIIEPPHKLKIKISNRFSKRHLIWKEMMNRYVILTSIPFRARYSFTSFMVISL